MSSIESDARMPRSSALTALARFVQFRSELAIVAVLAAAVLVGALVREVLPLSPGPSAGIAAPPRARRAAERAADRADRPAGPQDFAPQLSRP
jgi:hypothetical protein